jgi:hypothetical protein
MTSSMAEETSPKIPGGLYHTYYRRGVNTLGKKKK